MDQRLMVDLAKFLLVGAAVVFALVCVLVAYFPQSRIAKFIEDKFYLD